MGHAINKRQRLEEALLVLRDHPQGMTRAKLAKQVGVNRSTINKWLENNDLPQVYEEDDGILKFDPDSSISRISFHEKEITMLQVAAQLLVRQTNQHNPHAASALRTLAKVTNRVDKNISYHLSKAAAITDGEGQIRDAEYLNTIEMLSEARVRNRKVTLEYELDDGNWRPYSFSPYFIEPYAPGLTTHVIGFREPPAKIRTFKLERLRNVRLSPQDAVTAPDDFDPEKLLEYAWGIWYTDEEPELVELKFTPKVAKRVLETRWHRKQEEPVVLADGSVLWRCLIAEPREMEYWVRGWGSDVEVIRPEWLRDELIVENRKQAKLYGINNSQLDPKMQRVLRCWGKTGETDEVFHPAFYHILDVAHVANELLQPSAPPRFRQILGKVLHEPEETICQWLPYFVALHDIGKFSAAFQGQNETQKTRLLAEGFTFQGWSESNYQPHGVISQVFLEEWIAQTHPTLARNIQRMFAEMIGGHHGQYVSRDIIKSAKAAIEKNEPAEWMEIRRIAELSLRQLFLHRQLPELSQPQNVSTAVMVLTGFTILCDWLGSDQRFFKPHPEMDFDDYIRLSRQQARKAVHSANIVTNTASLAPTDFRSLFEDLFQDGGEPRALQAAIDLVPEELLRQPCLVIIEAPTGEGKTEAALALAHRLAQSGHGEDLYYALPTMATSNQMFDRLQRHLVSRLQIDTQAKLVHGQAFLLEDSLGLEPMKNGSRKEKSDPQRAELQWYSSKKRALLAPFGVGTIDQAELATLNVRHAALRMFGLMGKVVIIDEVHAYDTYMTTIIERLLRWLSSLGTSVILLSATLPLARREALAEAYGVRSDDTACNHEEYPSLLVLNRIHPPFFNSPKAWQADRILTLRRLEFGDEQVEEKAQWLINAMNQEGCVCWMTNTVKRAQTLFEEVQKLAALDVDLILLHSQFPLEDRQNWEDTLRNKYGRKGHRPKKGIVIGTQVLEQSLDLDFDLLVSDLAPVDLLLQRAGRLHRHDRPRPLAHSKPHLWINAPSQEGLLALSSADIEIYTEYILRQTWLTLEQRLMNSQPISLPTDYRPLIETVYANSEPPVDHPLRKAWEKLRKKSNAAREEAEIRLMPEPDPKTPFSYAATQITFEESENSAAWIVAQTRLGEESLNVIPLEVQDDVAQLPDGTMVDLNQEALRETQLRLLRRNLRVSNYDAIRLLKIENAKPKPLFKESALLNDYYLLPLSDSKQRFETDKHTICFKLDPRLGLVIKKEKK